MRRRDFLHRSSHAMASSFLFGGLAKHSFPINPASFLNPDNDHVLVLIFLNGGNDGLNTVIPTHQYDVLSQLRSHVLIPESKALPLNDTNGLGLHPSLMNMHSLYNEGKVKIIRGVGYPNQNYSHFRSTDIWMSGANADELIPSGILGRYLDSEFPGYPENYPNEAETDPLAVELGYANSLLFQGPFSNMSLVINGETDFYQLIDDQIDKIPDSEYADKLRHIKLIRSQTQTYGKVVKDAAEKAKNKVTYPDTWIANQLKIVARLIAGGLRTPIYKVELDGFDTHASQVDTSDTAKGQHANLLQQLDAAILAFTQDLAALRIDDRVVGMTFSEFGRRIISNASNGTDHGAAGPMFFFGNAVNGGVIGSDYDFHPGMTDEDNLPFQYDFRQAYSSVLQDWLCVKHEQIDAAMLGQYAALPILHPTACGRSTSQKQFTNTQTYISLSPNPTTNWANIDFYSDGQPLNVRLIGLNGQTIRTLTSGQFAKGNHQFRIEIQDLPQGSYYIQTISQKFQQSIMLQKL